MANLLNGLEAMGLGNLSGLEIYEKQEKEAAATGAAVKAFSEEENVFDKTYKCPVCDQEFKAKAVKAGKAKLTGMDTDLRPIYQEMDPLKYDSVVCPHCGYAALSRFFSAVSQAQAKLIKTNISTTFKGLNCSGNVYTYEDAIARHKLALINAIVKRAKPSEKAYICLKTAWILRGLANDLPKDSQDHEILTEKLAEEEFSFIEQAYNGFNEAFSKESFPMCGMDENTVTILIAELARRVGKKDECGRWISKILVSRDANERLKEKARCIKEMLRAS